MSRKNIEKAINRQISEKPLFTNSDRQRFYEGVQNQKRPWIHIVPKVVTLVITLLLISGVTYIWNTGNPFQSPAADPSITPSPPPVTEEKEKEEVLTVQDVVNQIQETLTSPFLPDEVDESFREIGEKIESQPDAPYDEYVFFKTDSYDPQESDGIPTIEPFQNGDLGLYLQIQWPSEETGFSVKIRYLSEDGEQLIEEQYAILPIGKFLKVKNPDQPVKMPDLIQQAVANSLNKSPGSLTRSDLLSLEELSIDASHREPLTIEEDAEYLKYMKALRILYLNDVKISGKLLKDLPNLEQITFIGDIISDFSSMSEGLQKVRYLNIRNSNFDGTVEDLLQLESLNIVTLDQTVIPNYEKLQFEGIDVRF
ncbi:hypothetical protein EQV77_07915 [Halobacillus fulvus]|nr:hypothetical protein EQV77_07915 [Halobacillus fulvus]